MNPSNSSKLNDVTNVTIISGLWPSKNQSVPLTSLISNPIPIPQQFSAFQASFTNYYGSSHRNASLKFIDLLSHAVIKANYPNGSKDLYVTLPQMLILIKFNTENCSYTFEKLTQVLQFSQEFLKSTLHTLINSKYPILLRESSDKSENSNFLPSDVFSYNSN